MNKFSPLAVLYFWILYSAWCLGFGAPLHAQSRPFYQGKILTFVVGVSPGGAYDVWARLIASHMSKHIPGDPQIIVQNMPGAGGSSLQTTCTMLSSPTG